jgi:hypothetical protein
MTNFLNLQIAGQRHYNRNRAISANSKAIKRSQITGDALFASGSQNGKYKTNELMVVTRVELLSSGCLLTAIDLNPDEAIAASCLCEEPTMRNTGKDSGIR